MWLEFDFENELAERKDGSRYSSELEVGYVTSTPGHVLTTSLLRPKKIKDVVRTWYGLVGRGRNVVRT